MIHQKSERPSLWHLIKQFIHLRRFAFTVFLPLMGAATATRGATPAQIIFIVVTAFQFHIFTYVLNDVVDLPVDRLMPKRATHPLVRGEIPSTTAVAIALTQVPLMLVLGLLAAIPPYALAALLMAVSCMAAYDIWGKQNAFPPITDLIQALSWGSLTLYGAWSVGDPTFLTLVLVSIFVLFILLMNGVFEGVIDIAEDTAAGLKTTAMIFGTKPGREGRLPFIPLGLFIYCLVLEAMLSALNLTPLIRNDFDYNENFRTLVLAIVIILNVMIVWLSIRLVIPSEKLRRRISDGHIDLLSAFSILILLVSYIPYLEPQLIAAILLFTLVPLIL